MRARCEGLLSMKVRLRMIVDVVNRWDRDSISVKDSIAHSYCDVIRFHCI